ncbi:MAG: nuclear transport factor 2 family protein [Bacteroidetes bacterium]|nr:nuclear transport factor 2 family protein [Bacteroidota bacterium]MBS1931271.1 nuclear transport factor 2 family protein [Bacteroidota bacterium]
MKSTFLIFLLLTGVYVQAQNKEEKELIARTYLLSHTVFGSKDSLTMEDIFATTVSYGHSHGKVQNRKEAIDGVCHNQSTYSDTSVSNVSVVWVNNNTAIVRHLFKATELTKDGRMVPLNFAMLLVWVKESGKWKLCGRQAVSLQ